MNDLKFTDALANNETFTGKDVLCLIHVHILGKMGLSKSEPIGFAYTEQLGSLIKNHTDFMKQVAALANSQYGPNRITTNLQKALKETEELDHYKDLYERLSKGN